MTEVELIYKQFRDHEDIFGETRTTELCLQAIIESIKELKCEGGQIKEQLEELFSIIKFSQPKIIPLIHLIQLVENKSAEKNVFNQSCEEIKKSIISMLEEGIEILASKVYKLKDYGSCYIKDNDYVVVHSVSSAVLNSVIEAKREGKRFRILVLKQDIMKTNQIIKIFDKENIEYTVMSELNVIHEIDKVTKVFLGATAVTGDMKSVMAEGTTGLVGVAHLHKIPIYLLVSSLKFSNKKLN